MKRILILLVLLVTVGLPGMVMASAKPPKSPLKVLFVGYDPAKPLPEFGRAYPGQMTKAGFEKEYKLRMPAFKVLLSEYFAEVKTIDCREWTAADSEPYDVTIFDFSTRALEPARTERKANGEQEYIPARYLPDNFSKPVVFISQTAPQMGMRIGLKLDALCLCLDADAHHVNTKHAIFSGPLEKVKPTLTLKPTPEGIYHYATGDNVPKQIPMWRVDMEGYMTDKDARIGQVSRGDRFGDSPDAEVISSGVNTKDVEAVALGRHGNFFLWGFGASPAGMTTEGKKVFVNVVAYMSKFDKKTPIARKFSEKAATTEYMKEMMSMSRRMYDEQVVKNGGKAKLSWDEHLKKQKGFMSQFGTDSANYQYLKDNMDYLYCDPKGFYLGVIDEEAKKIGVPNHDVRFLETCIKMLKQNDQSDLALKMLKKYTTEDFDDAQKWQNWFTRNKKKLFFTEAPYKFIVNTYSE